MFSNQPMLESLGFHPAFHSAFLAVAQPGQLPARVCAEHRGQLKTLSHDEERLCTISGRLRHEGEAGRSDFPHVGDWVAVTPSGPGRGVITDVLPRTTTLWRRLPGSDDKTQVLLCNVDVVCVVSALGGDVSPRRMERFLALILESRIRPVFILTKRDLCPSVEAPLQAIREVAGTVPVFAVSALTGEGMDTLRHELFGVPQSVALLGSSGVGKSTLINHWLGTTAMPTGHTLDDGRGRHTTTHRLLLLRPGGGVVMDTPGVREVGVLDAEEGILGAFHDVESLAAACRFADCTHALEPGCAVREAVETGALDGARLQSFHKLQRENAHARRKESPLAQQALKNVGRVRQRALRALLKDRGR